MLNRTGLGIACALSAAAMYGLIPSLVRGAFVNGIPPAESILFRTSILAVVFAIVAVLQGQSFYLPRAALGSFLAQCAATLTISLGYLASVQFIPVGLAVIIFFSFPVIIMLAAPLIEGIELTMRELLNVFTKHGIRIIHDMTRVAENAYMIQQLEEGQNSRSVAELVLEICSLTDGATMSAKKDALVNIGGFMATNEWDVFEEARNMVVIYEGLHTYGGLAGRDMEAMAIGIEESVQDDHIRARVGQVFYLGQKLIDMGIPIVRPVGTHGIFLDAKAFLPHLAQTTFPAQALAAELYIDSGVRAMERGIVSAGRDKSTGDHCYPELELVRLTIPRRVYTQAHMDVVAESVARVYERRNSITGLKMTYEPKYLRFFQARFEPLPKT